MHNRLRMIAASFLVKDLLVDWRSGERYFADKLIDFDLASNNGGWQWAASTGCDAQPYFRIFNPVTQSERFDADGKFIRRYVPELAALDAGARSTRRGASRRRPTREGRRDRPRLSCADRRSRGGPRGRARALPAPTGSRLDRAPREAATARRRRLVAPRGDAPFRLGFARRARDYSSSCFLDFLYSVASCVCSAGGAGS